MEVGWLASLFLLLFKFFNYILVIYGKIRRKTSHVPTRLNKNIYNEENLNVFNMAIYLPWDIPMSMPTKQSDYRL